MEILSKDLAGRIGKLKLKRGAIETPYLFPVIDITKQELSVSEIKGIGFTAVITNAYLTYKRGWKGSIQELLGDPSLIVMTDSGAYQHLQYGNIEVSNKEIIEIQKGLNSDIAVILDVPTGDSLDRAFAEETVRETLARGREALQLIDRDKRLWVLPIQGGIHLDILERSAIESAKLDYDIYAIGSPTRFMERYEYSVVMDMIRVVREHIRPDKPLHLFGAGHPMIIPFAVAMGIDLFDSASYILFARDGRYMTEGGTLKLDEVNYFPCNCPVCSRYTPQELRMLERNERTRLLALHNLYIIRKIINETKEAIREGRLWELLVAFSRKHPSLLSTFNRVKDKHVEWLELYTPRVKGEVKAIYLLEGDSRYNPKIVRARNFIFNKYKPPSHFKRLIIEYISSKDPSPPINASEEHIVYYAPSLGMVPRELVNTYPFGQNVYPKNLSKQELEALSKDVADYLSKFQAYYEKIEVVLCYGHEVIEHELKRRTNEIDLSKIDFKYETC